MKQVYMLVHELKENKGGMTSAMFSRSRHFYDQEIKTDFITFDYDKNYDTVIKKLKQSGKMDARTQMYNPFEYYDQKSSQKNKFKNRSLYKKMMVNLNDFIVVKQDDKVHRLFDKESGEYRYYVKLKNDEIELIDTFENNKRKQRTYFQNKLVKHCISFDDANKKISEIFYNRNGYPFIFRKINPANEAISDTYLLSEELQFKNNLEFCRHFINEFVKDTEDTAIICDGPGSFPKMLETGHKSLKKYAVIHINHYKNFTTDGSVKKQEDYILKNGSKIDGVIVLTEKQKNDILNAYDLDNIHVISNFINITEKPVVKDTGKIVGHVSRLSKQKGFEHIVKIARQVIDKDDEIRFHIYGSGEYEETIRKLIKEANLEDYLILKGYTNDVNSVLKDFRCMISTSYFEGQGLSMIESMIQCKPVLAFDIKYGPSDFIFDGNNGYLVKEGDYQTMVDRVLHLMDNPKKAQELGEKARDSIIDLYHADKLMDQWKVLFAQ